MAKKLEFPNSQGEMLAGSLHMPTSEVRAFALFAHCFTCSKDVVAASRISRALVAKGIATLRFDFTGLGSSSGDFANTHFSSNLADLVSAADFLKAHYQAPALLIGHSLGGAAVLAAASLIPSARALVTIGAPATAQHVTHLFADKANEIVEKDEALVDLGGRRFTIKRQFLEDIEQYTDTHHISKLDKALLVMHSPLDAVVPISEAAKIYQAAKHPKSFISLDRADHMLSNIEDSSYVADVIAGWGGRYMGESLPEKSRSSVPDKSVRVRERNHIFTCDVETPDHQLTADEPMDFGGHNLGPSPYEFVLSGLGACTVMTLRMVAERESIPMADVHVNLSKQLVSTDNGGKALEIHRQIKLFGDLTDAHRKRLMAVADRCPVHKSLSGEIQIKTESV